MRRHEGLEAWRRSHALALRIVRAARRLPVDERYVLGSQLRRAAISVPANLVEGVNYASPRAFLRHVRIAIASVSELDYLVQFASEAGYLTGETSTELRTEAWQVRGLLLGLSRRLAAACDQPSKRL